MPDFVQARTNSAAKRVEEACGPQANAIAGAERAAPQALSLLQMRQALDRSPQVQSQAALQRALDHSAAGAKAPPKREENPPVQRKPNATGLPDRLKAGVESLSGFAMDDVRVHFNSPKPAAVQAHAYTQGTDIHVAPGQERHLPHEAWHVVQQKQGRVKPTLQMKGVAINDDTVLESEADRQGQKALTATPPSTKTLVQLESVVQFVKPRKVDNQDGLFVGEPDGIHIHIVGDNDHLKLGGSGKRIDLRKPGGNNYDKEDLQDALVTLLREGNKSAPGYKDCQDWICDELKVDVQEYIDLILQDEKDKKAEAERKIPYSAYTDPNESRESKRLIETSLSSPSKKGVIEYPPKTGQDVKSKKK